MQSASAGTHLVDTDRGDDEIDLGWMGRTGCVGVGRPVGCVGLTFAFAEPLHHTRSVHTFLSHGHNRQMIRAKNTPSSRLGHSRHMIRATTTYIKQQTWTHWTYDSCKEQIKQQTGRPRRTDFQNLCQTDCEQFAKLPNNGLRTLKKLRNGQKPDCEYQRVSACITSGQKWEMPTIALIHA